MWLWYTVCLHLWLNYYVIWTCCACTFALFCDPKRKNPLAWIVNPTSACCQAYACQFGNIDTEYLDAALLVPTRGDDPTRGRTGAWNAVDAVDRSSSTDALHWVCLRCVVCGVCARICGPFPRHIGHTKRMGVLNTCTHPTYIHPDQIMYWYSTSLPPSLPPFTL